MKLSGLITIIVFYSFEEHSEGLNAASQTCYLGYFNFIYPTEFILSGGFSVLQHVSRGSLTVHSPQNTWCHIKKQAACLYCEDTFWHFTSPSLRSLFSSSRQLCQTVEELLTLTGSDKATQADVFLFALGETASLTLSWLILGPGLS